MDLKARVAEMKVERCICSLILQMALTAAAGSDGNQKRGTAAQSLVGVAGTQVLLLPF